MGELKHREVLCETTFCGDIVRLKSKYPSINDIGILVGSFLEMLTVVQLVERKFNRLNFMRCGC
jgi:hypothetical protein